jgi:membrane protease YdiL (CAAX protease family)
MKRNKIKNKYLNEITTNNANNYPKETKKIINFCKSLVLITLLLFWSVILMLVLELIGINYNNLTYSNKIIFSTICDISFMIFLIIIYQKDIIRDFKNFFNKRFLENLGISLGYWLTGLGIMIFSNTIIYFITNGGIATNEESVRALINKVPLYMLFDVSIYAPITEELIFRKSFKDFINNKYIYVLASGLVFGGLHIITSLDTLSGLLYLIPYGALGITFAMLYKKTDNIFSTILMHSLHNSLSFAILILENLL